MEVDGAGGENEEVLEVVDPADFKGGEHFLPADAAEGDEVLGLFCSVDLGLPLLLPLSSLGERLLFLTAADPLDELFIMSDSILLQALVNIAKGLILESISESDGSGCRYGD